MITITFRPYSLYSMEAIWGIAVSRIDIALVKAVEVLKKGSFNGGVWTLGLQDHGIELAYSRFNRDLITHEISLKLDEIEEFLINK